MTRTPSTFIANERDKELYYKTDDSKVNISVPSIGNAFLKLYTGTPCNIFKIIRYNNINNT